jgi:hypothetical protein
MTLRVRVPLAVVKTDGGYVHVYDGGLVPDNADREHVKLLLADGAVENDEAKPESKKTEDDEKPEPRPVGRPRSSK